MKDIHDKLNELSNNIYNEIDIFNKPYHWIIESVENTLLRSLRPDLYKLFFELYNILDEDTYDLFDTEVNKYQFKNSNRNLYLIVVNYSHRYYYFGILDCGDIIDDVNFQKMYSQIFIIEKEYDKIENLEDYFSNLEIEYNEELFILVSRSMLDIYCFTKLRHLFFILDFHLSRIYLEIKKDERYIQY